MTKVITDRFLNIEVFGKKLTKHHIDLILQASREVLNDYTNWLHVKGYFPYPHTNWQARVWYKPGPSGKFYIESDLYFRYLSDRAKEKKKEEKSKPCKRWTKIKGSSVSSSH